MGFIIGAVFTLITSLTSFYYLDYKYTPETLRERNEFFETLQTFEARFGDLKFQIRGYRPTQAPVALIAIDDDSVREIGRWPWSRETMSQLTKNALDLGAKSIGFDIIFSEPERGMEQNDLMMGKVVSDYSDRIVLGAFSESASRYLPYQDYCVTEAFLKTGGEHLVKLNPTLIVEDDLNDVLDNLDWNSFFNILFDRVQFDKKNALMSQLGKKEEPQLTLFQKNYLRSELEKSLFAYCHEWLTPQDRFFNSENKEQIQKLYTQFLSSNEKLKTFSIEDFKKYLIKQTPLHPIQQYPEWTKNIPAIQNESLYSASFLAKLDSDGYVRRYPMLYRSGNRLGSSYIPSLALQTYLLATGYRAEVKITKEASKNNKVVSKFIIIDPNSTPESIVSELPIDPAGQVLINYYGAEMSLPYIPAKEFFSDSDQMRVQFREIDSQTQKAEIREKIVNKKDFLKGRSLLAGATAIAIYDLRNTPTAPNYPGPEIHLTMLANLFQKDFLKSHSSEKYWIPLLMLALGISLSYILSYAGSIYSLMIVVVVLLIGFATDLFTFIYQEIEPSLLYAGVLVGIIYVTITIYRYFTEERKKQELKSTFSKYVSPAIVDELIKDPKNLQLGGRRQHMTVFFSDLRGFTTISEKLTPDELVKLLNRYLTPMTQIVFENKGTLDKYMGDAIMAFFGAPITYPDHAYHACKCALQSLKKLKELQAEFAAENLPLVDVGIGINTGDMSVGNMGSNIVQNYTVMGDAVNLASRLEGTNKQYGTRIIISEFTYKEVKDKFVIRELDQVKVKGKNEPVKIYEVIQEETPVGTITSWLEKFEQGYRSYLSQDFKKAIRFFQNALEFNPTDPVSKLYIQRCEEFLTDPPPQNWDGVYEMKTK